MKFYGETFGWTFQQFGDMGYWMVNTGPDDEPGIHGGLMKKNHPEQPVTNSIEVPDLDAAMQAVKKNGGTIVVPKMPIPGAGWLAYFKDPDQNIFGIMEPDPAAK
jgi:predicted enzyme related to lactoylglutathione lyase